MSETGLTKLAEFLSLDTEKLKTDAASEKVRNAIQSNLKLSQQLGISGTPAFIIGEQLLPGAVPLSELKKLVKEERTK